MSTVLTVQLIIVSVNSILKLNLFFQLFMGLVKLGFIVRYLSVPLTRGFTTGCAMHVFTSQVKYIIGIQTDRYSGPLKLIYVSKC